MSENVQSGAIGALLSQFAGGRASGVKGAEPGVGADASKNAPNLFSDVFNIAAATDAVRTTQVFETGVFTNNKRLAELASQDDGLQTGEVSSAFSGAAFEAPHFSFDGFSTGRDVPLKAHKELLLIRHEGRTGRNAINILVTDINKPSFALAAGNDIGAAPTPQTELFALTTVKLSETPVKDSPISFSTIKQTPPNNIVLGGGEGEGQLPRAAGEYPSFDLRNLRLDGNTGFRAGPADFFDAAVGTARQAPLELAPEAERLLDAGALKGELSVPKLQSAPGVTAAAQLTFLNTYSQFAGPGGAPADAIAPFDAEPAFDPALSGPSTATRNATPAAIAALSSAPTQATLSGVLPQIQAAVFARNGRDVVEVRLDPPDLGRVRINFNVENAETIKAVLGAERTETLEYLKRNIADLEQQLKQAGFASINFEFSGDQRQFRAEGEYTPKIEPAFSESADATPLQKMIYLSPREHARLDLLL